MTQSNKYHDNFGAQAVLKHDIRHGSFLDEFKRVLRVALHGGTRQGGDQRALIGVQQSDGSEREETNGAPSTPFPTITVRHRVVAWSAT